MIKGIKKKDEVLRYDKPSMRYIKMKRFQETISRWQKLAPEGQ